MKTALRSLWTAANVVRSVPAILAHKFSDSKDTIDRDITRWAELVLHEAASGPDWWCLHRLLIAFPEFRNLFYYRLRGSNPILGRLIQPLYPRLDSLFLNAEKIGAGLVIFHGFSTIVYAKSIGEDCTVAQQVTIGVTDRGCPTLGDNVWVTAGAVVIGGIHVGNDSIIGANATVTKNVPNGCVVVGNPAFIVRRNGVKTREDL